MSRPRVLITTVPFAARDRTPLDLMEAAGIDYLINPTGRKLKEDELAEMIGDFDALVAGTENIGPKVMSRASRLKLISRVGIGLDSVDLVEAERRGILVSYTPDAPAPAVAELTLGLMLSLMRFVHLANAQMHRHEWTRHFGRRLPDLTVGLIGVGRIGRMVLKHLSGFAPSRVLVNDLQPDRTLTTPLNLHWVDKEEIYQQADVISLHVPLTMQTRGLITSRELRQMKPDALLINTARGGIVREDDLLEVLESGHLAGAAIDVFEQEPYTGPLAGVERCLLTSHMGSMSVDCRTKMEIEATAEAVRLLTDQPLQSAVPEAEYEMQRQSAREGTR